MTFVLWLSVLQYIVKRERGQGLGNSTCKQKLVSSCFGDAWRLTAYWGIQ